MVWSTGTSSVGVVVAGVSGSFVLQATTEVDKASKTAKLAILFFILDI
jgi:hypothetical protein